MAQNSKIGWCHHTWNFLVGCDRVSCGCDGCYAIDTSNIRRHNPNPKVSTVFAGTIKLRDGRRDWTGRVNIIEDRMTWPLRLRKPGQRIFVNSLSDVFHDQVPVEVIARAFAVMVACPQHTFQLLTKRHGRMRAVLSSPQFWGLVAEQLRQLWNLARPPAPLTGVPPWIWIGVSAENQQWADIRIPALLDTPAATRWVSLEPLLGPIVLHPRWTTGRPRWGAPAPEPTSPTGIQTRPLELGPRLNWIVVGGESGHLARPMHPTWARSLRDQAVEAGIPFFFKQWGEWGPAPWVVRVCDPAVGWQGTAAELIAAKRQAEAVCATHSYPVWADQHGWEPMRAEHQPWSLERTHLDEAQQAPMRRWGKTRAGNELDGQVWEQFPAITPEDRST